MLLGLFSGISLYEPWIYQLYNTLYTTLPICLYGILDSEFVRSSKILQQNPQLYTQGNCAPHGKLFSLSIFARQLLNGALQSLLISLLAIFAFGYLHLPYTHSLQTQGMVAFGLSVLLSNINLLSFSHSISLLYAASIAGSYGAYLATYSLLSKLSTRSDFFNTFAQQQ